MNKLYIVGLPGAGKSMLAKELAIKMQWDLLDIDKEMERKQGKTVAAIFENEGEKAFRRLEKQVLHETSALSNTVISCGGGTPAFENNMEWMQAHGLTLFLNPPMELILQRIVANAPERPLFKGMNSGEIKQKLMEIVDERGHFYSRAKIVWNRSTASDMLYHAVNQLLSLKLAWP